MSVSTNVAAALATARVLAGERVSEREARDAVIGLAGTLGSIVIAAEQAERGAGLPLDELVTMLEEILPGLSGWPALLERTARLGPDGRLDS